MPFDVTTMALHLGYLAGLAGRPWIVSRLSVFTVAYNINLVRRADVPKSFDALLDAKWKGKLGIEADDNLVAALCMSCHHDIDQGHQWSRLERQRAWWIAHRKTVEILVEQGLWPLDVPIPDGTEWGGFIPLQ